MPDFSIGLASRNAALDGALNLANSGFLRIYSGSVPANADASLGGATLLAELTMGATAFAAASGGSKAANAITGDTSANTSGTASFFRLFKSDGTTVVAQGLCGGTGSGEDLEMATTSVVAGVDVEVTSLAPSFAA